MRLRVRRDGPADVAWMLAIVVAAVLMLCVASEAAGQGPPQAWVEPRVKQDTIVTPQGRAELLFGFARTVVEQAGLPVTAPARSFCAVARREEDVVLVDSIVSRASAELPVCTPGQVPLVIRPVCQLTYQEHQAWQVKRTQPAILFCGLPPQVFLLVPPPQPRA